MIDKRTVCLDIADGIARRASNRPTRPMAMSAELLSAMATT